MRAAVAAERDDEFLVDAQGVDEEATGSVEQIDHRGIGDAVEHVRAVTPGHDDAGTTQHTELLRQVRRLQADEGDEIGDGPFPVTEQLEDADATWMPEGLEEIGLDLREGPFGGGERIVR